MMQSDSRGDIGSADSFGEDDKHTFTITTNESMEESSSLLPQMKGIGLDLSFADAKDSSGRGSEGIQEQSVNVIFELPDGSQDENTFKLGQTVELLKSYVESEYGIPMMEQNLYLEDKLMMNPLSLLDYPEAKGTDELYVRVEGYLPSSSKK